MSHYRKEEYKRKKFDAKLFELEKNHGGPISTNVPRRLVHHQLHHNIVETVLLLPLVNLIELYLVTKEKRERRQFFISRIHYYLDLVKAEEEWKLLDRLESLLKKSKALTTSVGKTTIQEIATNLILSPNNRALNQCDLIYGDKISFMFKDNVLVVYWNGTSASTETCCFDFPSFYWKKTSLFVDCYEGVKTNSFVLPIVECSYWNRISTVSFQSFDHLKLGSFGTGSLMCVYQLTRKAEYKCQEIGQELFYFIALDYKVNNLISKNDQPKEEKIHITVGCIRQNLEKFCDQAGQMNQEDNFFKLMNQFRINPHRLFFLF
jgi:hypothetical protein